MKQSSYFTKTVGKTLLVSALAVVVLAVGSCTKEKDMGAPAHCENTDAIEQSNDLRASATDALRDFTAAHANGSNQNSGVGAGSNTYSNPALSYTTYSTPTANVYSWSDPAKGLSYELKESTGGTGLGTLSVNNTSFDYNYVLSIKASGGDPLWDSFLDGRELRGVVAISGELTAADFKLEGIAFFFVATKGGSGTYKFIDFDEPTVTNSEAMGMLVDLSGLQNVTVGGLGDLGKTYYTSGGHINVSDSEFEMASDAKVTNVKTEVKSSISGSIMFE